MLNFKDKLRQDSVGALMNNSKLDVKAAWALTSGKNDKPPRGYQHIKARADIWGNLSLPAYCEVKKIPLLKYSDLRL